MKIFSGLYVYYKNSYPSDWIGRAVPRHIKWCQKNNIDYQFVASPLLKWCKSYKYPESWTFGTFLKFEAMRLFLDDEKCGDTFFWIDLDIYPKEGSKPSDILDVGDDLFLSATKKSSAYGYPGPSTTSHIYEYIKLFWSNSKEQHIDISTCLFTLSRPTLEKFWVWLNKDYSIDDKKWWDTYHEKQLECKRIMSQHDPSEVGEYSFGSEEMVIEDWINNNNIQFTKLDWKILGDLESQSKFTHYYGYKKQHYPSE